MLHTDRATEFSKDLCKYLDDLKLRGLTRWQKNWPPPGNRDFVDAVGLNGTNPKLLVEVELRREDPASNVVKIWKSIHEGKLSNNIVLMQAFSRLYKLAKKPRKELATFLGMKMKESFPRASYIPLDFDYLPTKGGKVGGGARQRRARELAEIIAQKWEALAE